jgi:hypothetical protein
MRLYNHAQAVSQATSLAATRLARFGCSGDLQIAMAVRSTAEKCVCGAALPRHGDPKIAATER